MPPLSQPRYTGANTFSAHDGAGKVFWAFQGPGDRACLFMEKDGGCHDITPAGLGLGRPSLECDPARGLWVIGNKQGSVNHTPPRIPVPEYTPFPAADDDGAIAELLGRVTTLEQLPASRGPVFLPTPLLAQEWQGMPFQGEEPIHMPNVFRAPPARAYLLRISARAVSADTHFRIGPLSAPYAMTVTTPAPGVRADNGPCWVPSIESVVVASTRDGGLTEAWVQVWGYQQ